MSFVSFSLPLILIMRLFNTPAFRVPEFDFGLFCYFRANNGGDAQEDKTEPKIRLCDHIVHAGDTRKHFLPNCNQERIECAPYG